MAIFIKRKDDKNLLKYLLPYGYMRRHLARVYGYRVVNGDFERVRIEPRDVSGFHLADLLPLGIVMAWQRRHPVETVSPVSSPAERQIQSLTSDLHILKAAFADYRRRTDEEIERLSVECMRLEYALSEISGFAKELR